MRRDEDGWTLGYSPDGLVGDDGLIEIKAPRAKTHLRTILADEVPAHYMAQCQAGLLVTGRKWIDFVSPTSAGCRCSSSASSLTPPGSPPSPRVHRLRAERRADRRRLREASRRHAPDRTHRLQRRRHPGVAPVAHRQARHRQPDRDSRQAEGARVQPLPEQTNAEKIASLRAEWQDADADRRKVIESEAAALSGESA
jgi:hypothetical protein